MKDKDGQTPLHIACKKGNLSLVEYLVSKGANIEAKNQYGEKPLTIAIENNFSDIIMFLQSKGNP